MKVSIIGAGYVGLVSAACLAELGHKVIAIDSDAAKVRALQAGSVPIFEAHLSELLLRHHRLNLEFSTDIRSACKEADIIFICVGTPPSLTGDADLSYIEGVAREVAGCITTYKIIVEKSTVPVGTCEAIHRTLLLHNADPNLFSIASNPEFLREGTAVMDFLYPDRVLIGASDHQSRDALLELYRPILDGSYSRRAQALRSTATEKTVDRIVTSVKSAEIIKHASNAFLALKISFINSVATVCENVGADIREVTRGVGSDSRIGPRFLQPGIGYGGSCFPKDVLAFRSVAASVGFDFKLLTDVMEVNEGQKLRFISKVRDALWTLRGKRLAVLGLAFKGGTDDCRDSPAIALVRMLRVEGAHITVFDPVAMAKAKEFLPEDDVRFASDAYTACENADALLVLTEWPQFAELDWQKVRQLLSLPIVLDGKNLLDAAIITAAGLTYYGVGTPRSSAPTHEHRYSTTASEFSQSA